MKTERWLRMLGWTGVFLFLLAGACFAFDQAAPAAAAVAGSPSGSIWGAIGRGILAGAIAAGLGYAAQQKAADGSHEPFDLLQFITTLVIGALVGAYAGWKNIPLVDAESLPITSSVIMGLETVIKVIWRNGSIHLSSALSALKQGTAQNPTPAPPLPKPPGT